MLAGIAWQAKLSIEFLTRGAEEPGRVQFPRFIFFIIFQFPTKHSFVPECKKCAFRERLKKKKKEKPGITASWSNRDRPLGIGRIVKKRDKCMRLGQENRKRGKKKWDVARRNAMLYRERRWRSVFADGQLKLHWARWAYLERRESANINFQIMRFVVRPYRHEDDQVIAM